MNTIDFLNYFWLNNQYDPCSPSETALYHYLLFEAECHHWVMPFKIPTQMLTAYTGISKQGVNEARESLQKRGLITYSKGVGKGRPAHYSLKLDVIAKEECLHPSITTVSQYVTKDFRQEVKQEEPQTLSHAYSQQNAFEMKHKMTQTLTQELSQKETQNGTSQPTQEFVQDVSEPETPSSTQRQTDEQSQENTQKQRQDQSLPPNDIITQHSTPNVSQPVSQALPLSELRVKILNDKAWQEEMMLELSKEGIQLNITELKKLIVGFFDWQERQSGNSERNEADCRRHIFNNIKSRLKKSQQNLQEIFQPTGSN